MIFSCVFPFGLSGVGPLALHSKIWLLHSLGALRGAPYFFTSTPRLHLPPAAACRFDQLRYTP